MLPPPSPPSDPPMSPHPQIYGHTGCSLHLGSVHSRGSGPIQPLSASGYFTAPSSLPPSLQVIPERGAPPTATHISPVTTLYHVHAYLINVGVPHEMVNITRAGPKLDWLCFTIPSPVSCTTQVTYQKLKWSEGRICRPRSAFPKLCLKELLTGAQ